MGLKKSVVIVNEYTIKTKKGGTRGGTPGDYVTRYMSRNDATENLTPTRYDTESYITRYMTREAAVDEAVSVSDLKSKMRAAQGMGGVAFGYGDFSLSDQKLKDAAKDIQKNFDEGKTVLKTVLSFDEEYLREKGIIDPNFALKKDGDYRGNIDQMKLRMAIMSGMSRLAKNYDDLQYIGVIQVDTKHVHCHLAMVDRGNGNIMPDGTQRGKLTDKEKNLIRRGIDSYLDDKQTVKMMTANVEQDRRNTVCFVKKYTHQVVNERGFSQFLLACLPENRNLWRASTNRKEMQKPNAIVREYVEEVLKQPDSGYKEALLKVDQYARSRTKNEDLSGQEYRELYKRGQNRIIEQSMNSVYDVLKKIPSSEFTVNNNAMNIMAMPYDPATEYTDTNAIAEFGFKFRMYSTRKEFHKKEKHKYHDAVKAYEKQQSPDESSKVLYDYLKIEEEYNAMLLAKYQYFLDFQPQTDQFEDEYNEYIAYSERVDNLNHMKDDTNMLRMTEANAEAYGQRVYHESGGHLVISDLNQLDNRISTMQDTLADMKDNLIQHLQDYNMQLDGNNNIVHRSDYRFDDIKALDIHHLLYDFPNDFPISVVNINTFTDMANRRYDAFIKAKEYLDSTGQSGAVRNFPQADIEFQKDIADRLAADPTFRPNKKTGTAVISPRRTIRLDSPTYDRQNEYITDMIKSTVERTANSLQYE